MKGDAVIIEQLNQLLAYEMTAADQYLIHARVYADMGLGKLQERVQHEHEEELDHARRIIDRILFLGGTPDMGARGSMNTRYDVPVMLRADLEMELEVVTRLRGLIRLCEERQDYVTREMLRGLLGDTEEDHVWWLETHLALIDKMGLQNYLQSQMGGLS